MSKKAKRRQIIVWLIEFAIVIITWGLIYLLTCWLMGVLNVL